MDKCIDNSAKKKQKKKNLSTHSTASYTSNTRMIPIRSIISQQ